MDFFFFPPPFPLLTKPRNPLPEVKPSLKQGSFWRLFTLNIFWPADWRLGLSPPAAPPGPAPPVLRGDWRVRVKVAICLRPSLPLRPPGKGENRCFLCWGDPFLPGQSPFRRSAENSTKAQLLPSFGRFLPCSGRERVLPRSQGATRGWRSRKEAERKRGGAGERAWG